MGPGRVLGGSSGLPPRTQGSILSPHVLIRYLLSASGRCALKCSKEQPGKRSHRATCLQPPVYKDSSQEQGAKQQDNLDAWQGKEWQPAVTLCRLNLFHNYFLIFRFIFSRQV